MSMSFLYRGSLEIRCENNSIEQFMNGSRDVRSLLMSAPFLKIILHAIESPAHIQSRAPVLVVKTVFRVACFVFLPLHRFVGNFVTREFFREKRLRSS